MRIRGTRATADDLARIEAAFADMSAAVDGHGRYFAADIDFHTSILAAAHNQFFAALSPLITAILKVSIRLSVRNRDGAAASLPLHRTVADRIAARDPEGARLAMRQLILGAREDIDRGGPVDPGFIVGQGDDGAGTDVFRALEALLVVLLAGMVVMVFGNVMLRWFADSGLTFSER